ncbi:hypothetical protein TUM4644_29660 [Shewanella colwelliana]|nr:hypothetical protein TUM4644_29660 [Shewanella colwelliana]GIU34795.1 hypothetical protein TUM3794_01630 [Shewanella colwelliana]
MSQPSDSLVKKRTNWPLTDKSLAGELNCDKKSSINSTNRYDVLSLSLFKVGQFQGGEYNQPLII